MSAIAQAGRRAPQAPRATAERRPRLLAGGVVWIVLPLRVWLPRLVRRTARRLGGREEIWNGNRETFRGAVGGRGALLPYAIRAHFRHRRNYPARLAPYRVVRLRTQAKVDAFLSAAGVT